jgi:ATP-dependent protease ClpP protease subunit
MTLKLLIIHQAKKGYDTNVEPITVKGQSLHAEYKSLIRILQERTGTDIDEIIEKEG